MNWANFTWNLIKVMLLLVFISVWIVYFAGYLDTWQTLKYELLVIFASACFVAIFTGADWEPINTIQEIVIWLGAFWLTVGFGFYNYGFIYGVLILLCLAVAILVATAFFIWIPNVLNPRLRREARAMNKQGKEWRKKSIKFED